MNDIEVCNKAVKLFSNVFENIDYQAFYRKHFENPSRISMPVQYIMDDDEMCAMNAFDQVEVKYCNDTFWAVQSSDSAVSERYRKQGLFSRIQKNMFEYYHDEDRFEFGFPNENSMHGFIKLGWQHIGTFSYGTKVLSPLSILMNAICNKKIHKEFDRYEYFQNDYLVQVGENVNILEQDDFDFYNRRYAFLIKRKEEYYRWRLFSSDKDYKIVKLKQNGIIHGLIILERKRTRWFVFSKVVDWTFDESCDYNAIRKVLMKEQKKWANISKVLLLNSMSKEDQLFEKMGYKIRRKPEMNLIVKSSSKRVTTIIENMANWHISEIDVDTFMN